MNTISGYEAVGYSDWLGMQDNTIREIYRRVAERWELLEVNYLTIRDLVELSGCSSLETHALLLLLFSAYEEGSTCLLLNQKALEPRVKALIGENSTGISPSKLTADILNTVDSGALTVLIGGEGAFKPLVLYQRESIAYLYFQKYYLEENRLRQALLERLENDVCFEAQLNALKESITDVLNKHPELSKGQIRTLNDDQKVALGLAALKRTVLISGGPGTGKTSIAVSLLRVLLRMGIAPERIFLAAPTGRAAQRMGESVLSDLAAIAEPPPVDQTLSAIKFGTLHRLLRYSYSRNTFLYDAESPLPYDAVLVDEVSMVDMSLMARLLEALPSESRLVLLGDKDQLPSVDVGTVLADLIPDIANPSFSQDTAAALKQLLGISVSVSNQTAPMQDRFVILKKNYRSNQSILQVAQRVNEGDSSFIRQQDHLKPLPVEYGTMQSGWRKTPAARMEWNVNDLTVTGCRKITPHRAEIQAWKLVTESWAENLYLKPILDQQSTYRDLVRMPVNHHDLQSRESVEHLELIFRHVDFARILTFIKAGAFGCEGINAVISHHLRPHLDRDAAGIRFAGEIVMVTQNDYARDLFNGDVGVILKGEDNSCQAFFRRQNTFLSYPALSLPYLESAFAITIHKSQGSEYEVVLIVFPEDAEHRLLTREILYTALTRARRQAIIQGSETALRRAIERKSTRQSGLIQEALI